MAGDPQSDGKLIWVGCSPRTTPINSEPRSPQWRLPNPSSSFTGRDDRSNGSTALLEPVPASQYGLGAFAESPDEGKRCHFFTAPIQRGRWVLLVASKRFGELQDEFFATTKRLWQAQSPEEKLALLNELQRIVKESKRTLTERDLKELKRVRDGMPHSSDAF